MTRRGTHRHRHSSGFDRNTEIITHTHWDVHRVGTLPKSLSQSSLRARDTSVLQTISPIVCICVYVCDRM